MEEFILASTSLVLLFIVFLLTAVYLFSTWNFNYFEKQGIKGDRPYPLFGTFSLTKNGYEHDIEMAQKFGKVYGTFEGRNPRLVIAEPELLRKIMVRDFPAFGSRRHFEFSSKDWILDKFLLNMYGDEWKTTRSIMTPTFTSGKLKQMLSMVDKCAQNMADYAEDIKEKPFDAKSLFGDFTLDVIAVCAFGTEINTARGDRDFARFAKKIFSRDLPWQLIVARCFPSLLKYCPATFPADSLAFYTNMVESVLRNRKQSQEQSRRDFLQLLMEAETEFIAQRTGSATGKRVLDNRTLVAQSVLFILAGHETTATLLTFCFYELARNPEIQERCLQEIREAMAMNPEGALSYETVQGFKYLTMVLNETLRKHPPITSVDRTCTADEYVIDGVKLKRGMKIGIPIYKIHHDPELYPDPETFDPERFSDENVASRHPLAFLPFGAGPRNCIGLRFAMLEAKLALAHLLSRFRVDTCRQTEKKLDFFFSPLFLRPKSVTLYLTRRDEES